MRTGLRIFGGLCIALALLIGGVGAVVWAVNNPDYFKGSTGPQGPKGEKGNKGDRGPRGPRGPAGKPAPVPAPAPAQQSTTQPQVSETIPEPESRNNEIPALAEYNRERLNPTSQPQVIIVETRRSTTDRVVDGLTSPVAAVVLDRVLGHDRDHGRRDRGDYCDNNRGNHQRYVELQRRMRRW